MEGGRMRCLPSGPPPPRQLPVAPEPDPEVMRRWYEGRVRELDMRELLRGWIHDLVGEPPYDDR